MIGGVQELEPQKKAQSPLGDWAKSYKQEEPTEPLRRGIKVDHLLVPKK